MILRDSPIWRPVVDAAAQQRHEDAGGASIECPGGERCDRLGFDVPVEGVVVVLELLPVGEVSRPGPVRQREDHARGLVVVATDPGRRLDVLGGGLGLTDDDHHPEAGDVDADGDHVGGQHKVDAMVLEPEPGLALV